MRTEQIFIFGAGGHGKVVIDSLMQLGVSLDRMFVSDDSAAIIGNKVLGLKVSGPMEPAAARHGFFHVAIGNAIARQRLYEEIQSLGGEPLTIVHPSACVSSFSQIELGSFIAGRAVVAPMAVIRRGAIVNHGAVVDHDCVVGAFSHIAPNATLGGGTAIGEHVLIGAGANVLPGICVADGAVVGAGAVVTADVSKNETVVGMPARLIRRG